MNIPPTKFKCQKVLKQLKLHRISSKKIIDCVMLLGFRSGLKNLFFGLTMNGGKNKVITIKCTCIP